MLENFRLKVFRAVTEQLSFRKAGEVLYLTQPAVTLQIKTLEEELGLQLFERRASGVSLTDAGSLLLGYAGQLHALAAEAENQLANLKGGASGELCLGASTTIAQYVLPPLLAGFARHYPAIQLQVLSDNSEQISEGVSTGRFGLGLIEGPLLRRDLKLERWFDDEILLVVPAGHEWANLAQIDPKQLSKVPLVMRERGSGSRHVVEQGIQKSGVRLGSLRIAMELDSTEAILSCVEEGLGVGFVSQWAIARRSLVTLRLRNTCIVRSFSFVTTRTPTLESSAAAMLRFLQSSRPALPVP